MISVIGLGFKNKDVSLLGYNKIKKAKKVYIRSSKLSQGRFLKDENIQFSSFDYLFDEYNTFEEVYEKIAKILDDEKEDVVYLTDGSGSLDKVYRLLKNEKEIIPSCEKCSREILGKNYSVFSAYDLIEIRNIPSILSENIFIQDIDDKFIASEVKLKLSQILDDEEDIYFLIENKKEIIKLYELDSQKKYDYNTGVIIENKDFLNKKKFNIKDLMDIIYRLRLPDGCPWDREQTHESIRNNVIEEAYEVKEAIDLKDNRKLEEELGDLLLQSYLQGEIAKDNGEFDMSDIITTLVQKLIDRHPHVFGNIKANTTEDALNSWDNKKSELKKEKTVSESMDNVAKSFPGIIYAEKISKKASKANFDFSNTQQIIDKIKEELEEVQKAKGEENLIEEVGDLFFLVANLSRFLKIDGEEAINISTKKFIERFKIMEDLIVKDNKDIKSLSSIELDDYYNKAKILRNRQKITK